MGQTNAFKKFPFQNVLYRGNVSLMHGPEVVIYFFLMTRKKLISQFFWEPSVHEGRLVSKNPAKLYNELAPWPHSNSRSCYSGVGSARGAKRSAKWQCPAISIFSSKIPDCAYLVWAECERKNEKSYQIPRWTATPAVQTQDAH